MRRAIVAFALAVSALVPTFPAQAQGLDPATVALTAADVPSGLRVDTGQTGPETRDGVQGYRATFQADPTRVLSGSGGTIIVMNVVTLPSDPVSGLEDFVRSAKGSLPGSATDLAPPAVGHDSRAFTSNVGMGPISASMAGTAFRRNGVVVGVMVMGAGGQPQVDEALRLAQLVDARILAAQ